MPFVGRLLALLALVAARPFAQEQFIDVNSGVKEVRANGDIKTVHVSGGVYMLVGGGANIVVQVGNEGVLVVDLDDDVGAAADQQVHPAGDMHGLDVAVGAHFLDAAVDVDELLLRERPRGHEREQCQE